MNSMLKLNQEIFHEYRRKCHNFTSFNNIKLLYRSLIRLQRRFYRLLQYYNALIMFCNLLKSRRVTFSVTYLKE